MFADFLDSLIEKECSGRIVDRLEVKSSDFGVGTRLFAKCDCLGVSASGIQYSCFSCGREPGNYIWSQSGDGAGHYPVIEILSGSNDLVAALVIFDSPLASSPTIQSEISSGNLPAMESFELTKLAGFGSLRALKLGNLDKAEEVLVGDVLKLNDQDKAFSTVSMKGPLQVIAFCEPMDKTDLARPDNDMLTNMPDSPRPRILALISSSLEQLASIQEELIVENWPQQILAWRTSMVTTTVPMSSSFLFTPRPTAAPLESAASGGAAFCTQCGAKFLKTGQKFCQMCGAASLVS